MTLNDVLTSRYCSTCRQGRAEVEKLAHGIRDQIKLFMVLVHEEALHFVGSKLQQRVGDPTLLS